MALGVGELRCSKCGTVNPSANNFCVKCGNALAKQCPKCNAENLASSDFCGKCGASLGDPAPPQVVPLTPAAAAAAGERRQLTVMFCDLVGSTPLSRQLDSEEWCEVVSQYQQAVAGAVARFGAHIAKNLGDGLPYTSAGLARADDPERAARAGLAIIGAMAPLNLEFAPREGAAPRGHGQNAHRPGGNCRRRRGLW